MENNVNIIVARAPRKESEQTFISQGARHDLRLDFFRFASYVSKKYTKAGRAKEFSLISAGRWGLQFPGQLIPSRACSAAE
jgi:hypothetical protein